MSNGSSHSMPNRILQVLADKKTLGLHIFSFIGCQTVTSPSGNGHNREYHCIELLNPGAKGTIKSPELATSERNAVFVLYLIHYKGTR